MSLRQIKKNAYLLQQALAEDGSGSDVDAEELARQSNELDSSSKKKQSGFAGMMMAASSSEEEEEEEVKAPAPKKVVEQPAEGKKKKKKNKKRNKKKGPADEVIDEEEKKEEAADDDDMAFLDDAIKKNKEESKQMATMVGSSGIGNENSILAMHRGNFNFKRELKALFTKAMGGKDKEEGKDREGGGAQGAGNVRQQIRDNNMYTKKQRRMLLLQEKMANRTKKTVIANSKRQVLCTPEQNWPRIDSQFLSMKQVAVDKVTGDKIFSFVKSREYHSLQKEFAVVQQTMDIQALADFNRRNYYHHESLMFIADYLRLQGKFSEAATILERCLFAFETAFCYEFQFVPPVDSVSNRQTLAEQFAPNTRLDFYSKNQEPLNRVFADCILKYIDILGRKGCNRTALEFCKLFLCLDPTNDPYGILLRIDYYALRAKEAQYLLTFLERFPREVFSEETSLLVFPNLLMTSALAKKQIWEQTHDGCGGNDVQIIAFDTFTEMSTLNELISAKDGGESLVYAACLLYPDLVKELIEKVAKQNLNSELKKSYFTGYQSAKWVDMLDHQLFKSLEEEPLVYPWIAKATGAEAESDEAVRRKLYSIFMERSSILFANDQTTLWLKETIGHLLNMIEMSGNGTEMADEFIAKVTSFVVNPFTLDRYMGLKNADFTDDVTTVNPEELLGGAGAEDHGGAPIDDEAARAHQDRMVQEMMERLNNPNPAGGQQQREQQQQMPRGGGGAAQMMAGAAQQEDGDRDEREYVDRDRLQMMEEDLIQQVQEMAGVDLDEVDDEEYENLQMALIASMTAEQETGDPAATHLIQVKADDDDDLPVGEAANVVPAETGTNMAALANQFANWAEMRTAAADQGEEEKKGDGPDGDANAEEEKK